MSGGVLFRGLRAVCASLLVLPLAAQACGICLEDKVAATYDHEIVTKATASRNVVVFAAVEARVETAMLGRRLKSATSRVRGIDGASVRFAAAPPSLSFALDPKVRTPEDALAAVGKAAATPGLKLTLLKVAR